MQSQGYQNDPDYRYDNRPSCEPSHPFCPKRHVFLGAKIAIGAFVLAIAAWVGVLSVLKIGARGVDIMLDKPIWGWSLILGCCIPVIAAAMAWSSLLMMLIQWP
jgi:hypothetical protein